MKEIIFVSGNDIKLKEGNLVLAKYGIRMRKKNLNIHEPDLPSIEDVAEHKAREAWKIFHKPLVVEDTGIYFTVYNNFPGGYAKRIYQSLGLEGLLKLLAGKKRDAYFKAVVGYADSRGKIRLFTGELHGKIGKKIMHPEAQVLAYDKIFIPNGEKRTIVEMPLAEKNAISHRGKAFEKFGAWFAKQKK
jgi:XTP/dITP diphosphohydrolase